MRVRLVTHGVAAQTTWHPQPPYRIKCILCHRCVQGAAHTVDSPREAQHHLTPPVPTACRVCWCCIQMAAWRRCSAVPMMPTSCWAMTWSSTLLMVPCTSRTPTTCLRFAAWLFVGVGVVAISSRSCALFPGLQRRTIGYAYLENSPRGSVWRYAARLPFTAACVADNMDCAATTRPPALLQSSSPM